MTCITPTHDPFSTCAQKFILYSINLTSPYIHVACVYFVCFVLFVMLRMEPSVLVCARQLHHWATSQPLPVITNKEEFLVRFCFLVHSFPINILLNSTKAIFYITWLLPKNNWMPSVWAYKRGTGNVILDELPLWGFLKCFLKQIAYGTDLCPTLLQHVFSGLTPFPIPPKAWTCRLHSSAPSLESVFLSLPLSTFISLLILSIDCLTI